MLRLSEELEVNRSLKERVLCTVGVVSAEELNLPQHCPELDESGPREQYGHPETPSLRRIPHALSCRPPHRSGLAFPHLYYERNGLDAHRGPLWCRETTVISFFNLGVSPP